MKVLLKLAGFAAGILIALILLDNLFDNVRLYKMGYVSNRDIPISEYDAEEPGMVDVLCVGNSLGFCSIASMDLYRDYGYTAYNLSTAMQMPVETFFMLRDAVERQPVKVIFWEANSLSKPSDPIEFAGSRLAEEIKAAHPFTRYHYVWNNMVSGAEMRPYFKGYVINEAVKPYTGGEYIDPSDTRASGINPVQRYYFGKTKELCDKKGIRLVLFCNPSPVCYNAQVLNGLRQFAREEDVDFIDANTDIEKVGIDWDTDTYDQGDHLNLRGARKMTEFLAQYMARECALTDHRQDPAYRSWDELLTVYDQEVLRMEGTSYPNLEEEKKQERIRYWIKKQTEDT